MTKEKLRIVFLGTPDFAVESLKALVENKYNVVGVVTMPDRRSGRGMKLQYSPVKQFALDHKLPLLQPENLKDPNFIEKLRLWKADLQIVVAFRMLPEQVWNMPPQGTFNLHGSLLPQYRGAAPINWAIINGEKKTGVTTFFLVHEIDKGNIILQEDLSIGTNDNAGYIHDQLMLIGAKLVCKTVDQIIADEVKEITQKDLINQIGELKTAPKIFRETRQIDWQDSATKIHNLIRGMAPYPVAWTNLNNGEEKLENVKIHAAEIIESSHTTREIGKINTDGKSYINIVAKDAYINILKIQIPGRRAMDTEELLRGFALDKTAFFS